MLSRAKINKYGKVISKQSQVQMCNGLKSQAEIHENVARKTPKSMNDQVYSGFGMDLCTWREFQIFKTAERKWTISTFVDYFIVITLDRVPEDINGTLVLDN